MKNMLVIAGPSAVGKTTVSDEIIRQNDKFTVIRSATTRAPRGDGHDGEYVYLSREEFLRAAESGDMLEYTEYSGDLYGTRRTELSRAYSEGRIPLLILDLRGVGAVRESEYGDALCVYLYDSLNTLEERLYARYMTPPSIDGLTKFVKRKEQNIADYLAFDKHAEHFDLLVSNAGEVKDTAEKILAAMTGEVSRESVSETVATLYAMADEKIPK